MAFKKIRRIGDINSGALEEQFQRAFMIAVSDILDPGTEAEAKRTITLKIEMMPAADRSVASVATSAEVRLAKAVKAIGSIMLDQSDGELAALVLEEQETQLELGLGSNAFATEGGM